MVYQIEISPTAVADIERIFLWLKEDSPQRAYSWVRGCYEIMLTLENFPRRCSLAPESDYMGIEVRQLLYKKSVQLSRIWYNPGRRTILPIFFFPNWRIIFQGINAIAASGKCCCSMGGTDGD